MNRKPRSLSDLEHWKATEFRQFILYISPLLIDVLPNNAVSNIMLLKFGITIILSETLNAHINDYASKLLKLFVSHSIRIYGKEFCVYNVHSIIHLADDAKLFNTLNNTNCFPFENYLGFLKRTLRKSHQNLEQVVNRIVEGREMKRSMDSNSGVFCFGKPIRQEKKKRILKNSVCLVVSCLYHLEIIVRFCLMIGLFPFIKYIQTLPLTEYL